MVPNPDLLNQMARVFKALAEPARLRLLYELQQQPACVIDLAQTLGMGQPNVSRHLQVLSEAGLISGARDGIRTYYRMSSGVASELCRFVCAEIVRNAQATSAKYLAGDGQPVSVRRDEEWGSAGERSVDEQS